MSYYADPYRPARQGRSDHEKAWQRSKATAWDAKWQGLSADARKAYLEQIKGPAKEGSQAQPSISELMVDRKALAELVASGFVKVEPGAGKRPNRVVSEPATYDFSTRIRSIHRYHLLRSLDSDDLLKYIKYAYYDQGEMLIGRVLARAKVNEYPRIEIAIAHYLTSHRWPEWAAESSESKAARPIVNALVKAQGPLPPTRLPEMVPGQKPAEVAAGLEELIAHLAVFEDLDSKTLELVVGLLPDVRERLEAARKPRARPPLELIDAPKELGPMGGTGVNDLRVFLLEVAGESPRLRQDGGIFQKDIPRLEAVMPPWPAWLEALLSTTAEHRVDEAYARALAFKFVEAESDEKQTWLRLSGKGRQWLASGLEQQYRTVYEALRSYGLSKDHYGYRYDIDDAMFLGIGLAVITNKGANDSGYYGYRELKPQDRQAMRDAVYRAFAPMEPDLYYTCESLIHHMVFEGDNPLIAGRDPSRTTIHLDQRPIPRLPERQEVAGKQFMEAMFRRRLIPYDAFRVAIDERGRHCVARLPRFDGYFGRDYEAGEDPRSAETRVIVQPDFSVMVIGLDPAPAAELAAFCERSKGHLGEGAMTFRITRESVVRASSQGISGDLMIARLRKHASVELPDNVVREVREWAAWVRLVNVRQVTVVRCPDADAASRVLGALGSKAERLGDTLVALHVAKLGVAERDKLQKQGIIVTKEDIQVSKATKATSEGPAPAAKKRGRPRKVR